MARVLALTADLLFGSRLAEALTGAGHDVHLCAQEARLREQLAAVPDGPVVLVADLTDPELGALELVEALAAGGHLAGAATLAFYSHVEAPTRERALSAGFDLVVPRSRMAREGAALVTRLATGAATGERGHAGVEPPRGRSA